MGYGRCSDFTRTRLGRSSRWLGNLAALGKGLAEFPALRSALCGENGETPLSRVAATALARFATVDTVDAWIELARCVTVREFRNLRAARLAGSSNLSSRPARVGTPQPTRLYRCYRAKWEAMKAKTNVPICSPYDFPCPKRSGSHSTKCTNSTER